MEKITRVKRKQIVDLKGRSVADIKTGEIFNFSDLENVTKEIPTHEVKYSYDEFAYFNTGKLKLLLNNDDNSIKLIELALLFVLSCNLSFGHNICMMDVERPHNTKSISEIINYSEQATKKLLNRLVKSGVLAYEKFPGKKDFGKVYIVNPYYVRIGEKFSDLIPGFFKDVIN